MAAMCHTAPCAAGRALRPQLGSRRCSAMRPFCSAQQAVQSKARRSVGPAAGGSPRTPQPQPLAPLAQLSSPALVTLLGHLMSAGPASAEMGAANPFAGVQSNSLYVTLALFVMSVPGEADRKSVV